MSPADPLERTRPPTGVGKTAELSSHAAASAAHREGADVDTLADVVTAARGGGGGRGGLNTDGGAVAPPGTRVMRSGPPWRDDDADDGTCT